jgi:hypothetical protein
MYDLQLGFGDTVATIDKIEVGGRERYFEMPEISTRLVAQLGDNIKLLGYDEQQTIEAEQRVIQLFWQAIDTPPADYTVFLQLLDANNQIIIQQDSQPQHGLAPTGSWTDGEIIRDEYTISFAPNSEQNYRLIVGMYSPETGERLPVVRDSVETDAIMLMTIAE